MKTTVCSGLLILLIGISGCGEKTSGTATAPVDAKPVAAATAPNAPPAATVTADDVHPGKAIHDANCVSCHDTGVYTREDRKIKDFTQLDAQVRRCDANLGTRLFDEDITKVVSYLNDNYYKFAKP